jgi:hypothetical protein
MALPNFIKAQIVKTTLSNLANNNDLKTTILGVVLAGVQASNLDYGKLLQGDSTQIANAITAVLLAVFGYFTNKKAKPAATPVAPATDGK